MGLILKRDSRTPVFSMVKLWFFLHPYASGPKLRSRAGVILYLSTFTHTSTHASAHRNSSLLEEAERKVVDSESRTGKRRR